jgi:D-arabinose 1-dehydrogenase-like Zn-dependent alcohol dehydrogenase
MRAQVLEAFNTPYTLKSLPPPPPPGGHDLLIRVLSASYCHTDAVFASGSAWRGLPRIGSHEIAGTVAAIGPLVSSSLGLEIGTLVGAPSQAYHPCGECWECKNNGEDEEARPGYGYNCPKCEILGLTRDGGFQDFCTVDSRMVVGVPEGMKPTEVAPLMCAGVTVWNALERADVNMKGDGNQGYYVGISGAGGGLGHLGVQFAARLGCRVVAIEAADKPLALLSGVVQDLGDLGKNVAIIDARTERPNEVKDSIFGATEEVLQNERGCDAVLILPDSQEAFDYGMKLLKNHGTCVVVSFPREFRFDPNDVVFRDVKIVGALLGRNAQLRAMLEFAAGNNVRANSKVYSLERLNQLVEDYHKGLGGKLVVDMEISEE